MIGAIIFDMDGLLIDSETIWHAARLELAAEWGRSWTDADHRAVMGAATNVWVAYMADRMQLDMAPQEIEQTVVGRVAAKYDQDIPFMPGAREIIEAAATAYPTALASGSVRRLIDVVTAQPALKGYLDAIVSADEVERGKPHPDVYLEAARQLGVEPAQCLCLEDSGNGIAAGKAAGMTVIAVPDPRYRPTEEALALADEVVDSLHEAKSMIFGRGDRVSRLPR